MPFSEPHDPFGGVAADLREAMQAQGFEALTAIQRALVSDETRGRDLRISSETGSGKTAALGLLLARELGVDGQCGTDPTRRAAGPRALVITPTRELAMQVRGELDWLLGAARGVAVGVVTGGADLRRERQMLARPPCVLVATPGRLLDHLRGGGVCLDDVRQVALDEADHMLDMGFKDELDAIVERLPAERRSYLMSATFPQQVARLADRFQRDPLPVQGTALGEANADIEHVVHVVHRGERYAAVVNTLLVSLGQRCLIFVQRRVDAAKVADMLCADGFSAAHLSGELAQGQRTRTLESFRNGTLDILVATDVAARGLDVHDIAVVLQAELPHDVESYIHRSGRTGRAGQRGRSVLLVPVTAVRRVERMLEAAGVDASWAPAPTAKQIRKAQRKRQRRALHTLLRPEESGDDGGPAPTQHALTEAELEYAGALLQEHDAAHVIATLLRLVDRGLPCKPRDLTPTHGPRPPRAKRRTPPPPDCGHSARRPPRAPRGQSGQQPPPRRKRP